ncbi:MAG TPA: hypothetical protein VM243_07855 [Phycisphaerae bacterium]|nr:hypothetical protein [Phycisphaerae bacterium]
MMGAVKKAFRLVALLALLNVLAAGAGLAYLVGSGRLTAERVEQIATVLRGEWPAPQTAQAQEIAPVEPPAKSAEAIENEQTTEQITRHMIDRRMAELEQQAATARAALLKVTREREAHQREKDEFAAQRRQRDTQERSEGFRKDLALLGSLNAKVAVDYLLQKPPEDAAQMLLQMETRKAKRIIEAAKTTAQKKKMGQIYQLLSEMAPADSELLAGNGS